MKTNKHLLMGLLAVSFMSTSILACAQTTTRVITSTTAVTEPAKDMFIKPMRQMVTKMNSLQATGDPDFDYAYQAKVHTQAQLDLIGQEIQNGKDTAICQMAKNLQADATKDMATIDNALRVVKPTKPNQTFKQQQDKNIKALALKFQGNDGVNGKLSSDIDQNFLTMLTEQRQDAIDMAKTYLQFGRNETLRAYAQSVVDSAPQQISTMKARLKAQ